jgi:hypothetical protein
MYSTTFEEHIHRGVSKQEYHQNIICNPAVTVYICIVSFSHI